MNNIYRDIAERTGGDIYLGVVGPVRSGKSTFVSQFINKIIAPNISDVNEKKRATDELPQSADGKIIMTTQPKFVPNNAVKITLDDKASANVRLIDCVGYLVDGAEGHLDGDRARLVNTPWSSEPMTFEQAAEIGTKIVATEHSTVAVVVTTDGSFGEIPRSSYFAAEDRAIVELQNAGKPFVVILNTTAPNSEQTLALAEEISAKHGVTVIPLDVLNADKKALEDVVGRILAEFPVVRIAVNLPKWMRALKSENSVIAKLLYELKIGSQNVFRMKDADSLSDSIAKCDFVESFAVNDLDMAKGVATFEISPKKDLFFRMLSEEAETSLDDEYSLMKFVAGASVANREYNNIRGALEEADANGYGVVYPQTSKMTLDEPQMIKQGSVYGVLLKAQAPSYHIIKVNVNAEVSPMVGTEQQSKYLLDEYKANPQAIWNANMFGRSMAGIAEEGLNGKCARMPVEVKQKLCKTVGRIVNENKGGLICLLL